jgi:SAM-dependent methyltransferase
MLEIARGRAKGPVEFREVDAQTADLGRGGFDAVYSRFGVMFFEDPAAAFANIRTQLKPGGRLAFVCWRSPAENPLMVGPMIAAAPLLPPQPPPDPLAPGPFAFADPERVRGILEGAGFTDVAIEPFNDRVGAGGLDQAMALAFRVGPLGRALAAVPEARESVTDAVRGAIEPYVTDAGVKMPAAVWIVTARNG